jgi:hypothetical protein
MALKMEKIIDKKKLKEIEKKAKECEKLLLKDIDTEEEAIKKTHNFQEKIMTIDNIFLHLYNSKIQEYEKLHNFIIGLSERFTEIQKILKEKEGYELHFIEENRNLDEELKEEIKHNEWRAAWRTAKKETEEEVKELEIDMELLKYLHIKLDELLTIITDKEYVIIQEEKIVAFKEEKKELKNLVHFIHTIYKFIKFYEKVFENMVKKEKHFLEKAEKNL